VRRVRKTPHDLGYRFYRGYIYQRRPMGYFRLWNPRGGFICILGLRDIPRYVDKSIKFGWEKALPTSRPYSSRFEQIEMFKEAA
jgi:hypothetical protein